MVKPDRVVFAAPGSGEGKTTAVTGLLGALKRRGDRVAPFKVGPDYIDPGYHRLAAGRTARNLDPVLVGADRIAPLLHHGAAGADIAVVEGVMGLFDGRIGAQEDLPYGSTAHVAELIDAPVVLVVDARGQSQSLAALLHGFRSYRPQVRVAGVLLNRVGSARHEEVLRSAAESAGLPVLGAIPRAVDLEVPSRHLGLVTAVEHGAEALRAVEAMTDVVEGSVDLDAVAALARTAGELPGPAWDPAAEVRPQGRPVVAVAGGHAFSFGYAEYVELLEAAGAEVALVDPLRDERLPRGTAGLVLPGGFPEQHASALSANTALRNEIRGFAGTGAPVHAECGGLLYLGEELDGEPMCGALPVRAAMTSKLTLGYRDAVAATESPLFAEGSRVSGHEFHRTATEPGHGEVPAWFWRGPSGPQREGFVHGGVHASYLHTHPAGNPDAVARFVARCLR
ncbi:cobyrinate a,c-diamide synthase [Saccharopolyspora dendranthemae]|uniref:Hydrogenobyrinate a,c-diamide synthase n=1 Tax=Saccharopolyspora dendranthemae TaxID=1181886 RepID=A0A561VB73_9PSEU|nr:cobyrinate a,c-diamide synthase [Saccharopolyspora dendranthemae]TWG08885.1 cobyrinic acid a,c-diamide synthase [Saccharopolyspora dendranthemae]